MVAMIPGTGGTLKATTVEAAIFEVGTLLEIAEDTPANNPASLERITIDKSSASGILKITFNLYGAYAILTSGQHQWIATEYLSNLTYVRGTSNTLKSTSYAGTFAEAVDLLKQSEVDPLKNPLGEKHIDYSYGMRGLSNFKGVIDLKFTDAVNALGNVVTSIQPWYS